MELRQLRYFVTLAEELHFGKAAAREHIVQSALSQQLQRLERELGVPLLERTTHHVRLTQAGSAFLLEQRRVRPGWVWLENRWVLFDGAGRREFDWLLRLYSGAELDALLRRAGFTSVDLHGSLAGAPYDHEARRLVAVARK